MRELDVSTITIRSFDRAFNVPAQLSFARLDRDFDTDDWSSAEPVRLTIAGTLVFKGTARRRSYRAADETVEYDAVDGLSYLAGNPCPVVHEHYNRVKASDIDAEPVDLTIHEIVQTEFASLVGSSIVSSLDTSAANSVIPGEVSPKGKTCFEFLETLLGYQPALRFLLDYSGTTSDSPYPAGVLKLIDIANLSTETIDLVVAQGEVYSAAQTPYNVEALAIEEDARACVDAVRAVGSDYFEVREILSPAWTPTWADQTGELVAFEVPARKAPLLRSHIQSVVVADAATPSIVYTPARDYTFNDIDGYLVYVGNGSLTEGTTCTVDYQYLGENAFRRFQTTHKMAAFRLVSVAGTVCIHPHPAEAERRWYRASATATNGWEPLEKWQQNHPPPAGHRDSRIVQYVDRQNRWHTVPASGYPYRVHVPVGWDIRMRYTARSDLTITAITGQVRWHATHEIPARSFFRYTDASSNLLWDDSEKLRRLALAHLDAREHPVISGLAHVTMPASTPAVFEPGKRVNIKGTRSTTWSAVQAVISAVDYADFHAGACEMRLGKEHDVLTAVYPEPKLDDLPEPYLNTWGNITLASSVVTGEIEEEAESAGSSGESSGESSGASSGESSGESSAASSADCEPYLADTFDRSDEDPLGSPWTLSSTLLQLKDNEVLREADSNYSPMNYAWHNTKICTDDHYVQTVNHTDNADSWGVYSQIVRSAEQNNDNCYLSYCKAGTGDETAGIIKRVNDVQTVLGWSAESLGDNGATHNFQLRVVGTTLSVRRDGVEKLSLSDSDLSTGRYVAFSLGHQGANNVNVYANNFTAGDI